MKASELAKIFAAMDPNVEVKIAACVDDKPVVDSISEVIGNTLSKTALIKTDLFVAELNRRLDQKVPDSLPPRIVN